MSFCLVELYTCMQLKKAFNFLRSLPDKLNHFFIKRIKSRIIIKNKSKDKKNFDPVTNLDQAFEKYIRSLINKNFPNDAIIGEEFKDKNSTNYFTWSIDPIDGTKAFVIGAPTWSNLISLSYQEKSLLGLVHDKKLTKIIGKFGPQFRIASFDALNFCLLAEGKVDAVIEGNLKPYDILPLIPIIRNSGGIVSNWKGEPAEKGGNIIASSNRKLHKKILKLLKPFTKK